MKSMKARMPSEKLLQQMAKAAQAAAPSQNMLDQIAKTARTAASQNMLDQIAKAARAAAPSQNMLDQIAKAARAAAPSQNMLDQIAKVARGAASSQSVLEQMRRPIQALAPLTKSLRSMADPRTPESPGTDSPSDEEVLEGVLNEDGFDQLGFEERMTRLIRGIERLQNRSFKWCVVFFVINLLCTWWAYYSSLELREAYPRETCMVRPAEAVRQTRRCLANCPMSLDSLVAERVVAKHGVVVRQGPRGKSLPMGTLELGDVVRAERKRKKWVRIEPSELSEGNVPEGWVPKKYLKRVHK